MKKIVFLLSMIFAWIGVANSSDNQASPKDEEVVYFLITVNNNEISAANLALQKAVSEPVKTYADLMVKDHTKNLADTIAISKNEDIKPLESEQVIVLKDKGKEEIVTLSPLTNTEFEKAYINDMVNGHAEVLSFIDTLLLKEVSNPQLKNHLIATREHVVHHLDAAKEVQKELN
jgi:putative membrane protein